MIAATIGNYSIVAKLGEGGMGVVYVAQHALLERRAAIKVLLPALSTNQEIVNRFFNEAKASALISDPGIIQIFDFGYTNDGCAFIVMELLDGEPMDKRLERIGRFSPLECLRLMRLICTSLSVAHARGIVHRDLKPENIFIVRDPAVPGGQRPKILDFGIAKLSMSEPGKLKTRTGMIMGTPVYMSPEQCRGASDIDHRSDIYTMGCVMFTMLSGRPPFDSDAAGELIAAHLREPPPLAASCVPDLPGIIDEILQRCLKKSPTDRFASMMEVVDAIAAAELQVFRSSAPTIAVDPSRPLIRRPATLEYDSYGTASATTTKEVLRAGQTTLSGATGQTAPRIPISELPKRRRSSVGLIASIAVVSAVIYVVSRSPREPNATSGRNPGESTNSSAAAKEPARSSTPASMTSNPAPSEALPVLGGDLDAGVPDATPAPPALVRALPAPVRPRPAGKNAHASTTGGEHAVPSGSAKPATIERGD